MIAKCPHCGVNIDTAKLTTVPVSHTPIDHQTKKPVELKGEVYNISGTPEISKKTVKFPSVDVVKKEGSK